MMHVSAMMALAARFSENPWFENSDRWTRGRIWADYSKRLYNNRQVSVSLAAIQGCVLLGTIAYCEIDMDMQSLYNAQAIRMIQLKDFPDPFSNNNIVYRETEIRVWWSVWMQDHWDSAGAQTPQQLVLDPNFPTPMEERCFEQLSAQSPHRDMSSPPETVQSREHGLWAQMIPMTEIIASINQLHEMIVQGRLTDVQLFDLVESIAGELDSWKRRLPKHLEFTPQNLMSYAANGHGRILVALHSGFHHQNQLLYYQFLQYSITDTMRGNSKVLQYASRCHQHAADLTNLFWLARQTPQCESMWPMVGHLLAISSSVHLHSLLFDDDESRIANVKQMLTQNFEMMTDLRRYWPSIDLSMSRLRIFHQALRKSMNTTFNMDHWMLLFLQRHTKPVEERDAALFGTAGSSIVWPTLMSPVQENQNYSIDDVLSYAAA